MRRVWIALLALLCARAQAKRNYAIDVSYCECLHVNPAAGTNVRAASYKVNGLSTLDISFDSLLNISAFSIDLSFDLLRKDMRNINLMRTTGDGCKSLENSYNNNLLRSILHELNRSSNLPRKCPLKAQHYYVANMTLDPNNFAPMMPAMNWQMSLRFFTKQMLLGDIVVRGSVRNFKL